MDFVKQLTQFEDFATNYSDLERLLKAHRGHSIKMTFHDYRELPKIITTDSLFGSRYNTCALLLPAKIDGKTYFHWSILMKRERVVFWEPYGLPISKLTSILGDGKLMDYIKRVGADTKTFKYQARISHISLCGQYCILRAVLGEGLSNSQFHTKFTEMSKKFKLDFDILVSLLTLWNFFPMPAASKHKPRQYDKYRSGSGLRL